MDADTTEQVATEKAEFEALQKAEAAKQEAAAKAEKAKAEADAAKQAKAEAAAAAKVAKQEAAAAAKQAKAEAAAAAKAAKAEATAQAKAAKEQAASSAKAAKEQQRMPEQNGIRRPKPEGLCGQAWNIFDDLSKQKGSPVAIKEALEVSDPKGLNPANVRTEYARWRKFYGITGRIDAPKAPEAPAVEAPAPAVEASSVPPVPA